MKIGIVVFLAVIAGSPQLRAGEEEVGDSGQEAGHSGEGDTLEHVPAAGRPIPGAEAVVVRTIMPEAYPGSFAVIFPGGPTLCFDPVRGGINSIWTGSRVDFTPAWTGKIGKPVRIHGTQFYSETALQPLRRGDPDGTSEYQFKGYRLRGGFPVFSYRIGDCRVHECLRPLPDGRGIVRRFETDAPGEIFWLLSGHQADADCLADQGLWEDGRLRVRADEDGVFTVTIRRKEANQ